MFWDAARSERTGRQGRRSTLALAVALLSSACGLIAGLEDKSPPPAAHGGAGAAGASGSAGSTTGKGGIAGVSGVDGVGGLAGKAGTAGRGSAAAGGTVGGGAGDDTGAGDGGTAGDGTSGNAGGGAGGTAGGAGSSGAGGSGGAQNGRPPSCESGVTGAAFDCGLSGEEDCCESPLVEGGGFDRAEATPAVVSDFRLDRFEVTVARFRAFQQAVDDGYRPRVGSGKREHLDGGSAQGELGWLAAWDDELESSIELCSGNNYTSNPGPNDRQPITCTSYYQAVAFCIWDRGFLPTSAEMMYVMQGGEAELSYPWGNELDTTRAVYGGAGLARVGSKPDGESSWGQRDVIGNVWEIVVDNDWPFQDMRCAKDCALFDETEPRVYALGGSWETTASSIGMADAHQFNRDGTDEMGLRCARAP